LAVELDTPGLVPLLKYAEELYPLVPILELLVPVEYPEEYPDEAPGTGYAEPGLVRPVP